jgi:antitoxin ParD1/3/4
MMMTITLNLSPEVEAQLRLYVARHDVESMQILLAEALFPTVEALLSQSSEQLINDEFEAVADQLGEEMATYLGPNPPVLSDYALSRAGIYEEHS